MPLFRAALVALLFWLGAAEGWSQDRPPESPAAAPDARLEGSLPRRCAVCHLDKAPAAPPGRIVFAPPGRDATAGGADMCYSCHNGVVADGRRRLWTGRHHPSSGRVSCGSCHTPHARSADVGTFMRYPRGSFSFCASCHPGRRVGELGEHPAVAAEKGKPPDCGGCHVVHGATGDGLIRSTSAEGLCTSCHGENPSRSGRGPGTTTHLIGKSGPACLDCHRVHKTVGGKALLDKAAHDGRLCRRCHERSFSAGAAESNHPASAEAACLACHRMHNAEKPGARRGLLAVAWAEAGTVCLKCHETVGQTTAGGVWNHPVGGPVAGDERNQAARLARSGAFFAPGGKLTCLSCHRAHGGRAGTPQLVTNREALCLYCHGAQNSLDPDQAALGAHPVFVRPRRARVDAAFLNAGGVTGPGGELICSTCHRAHRGRPGTPGLVLPRESYSCLLCHSRETSIASTGHSNARAPGSTQGPGAAGLCGGCHGEHGWRVPLGDPADGRTAIERICLACHGGERGEGGRGGATNHPLGAALAPGRRSGGLPLYWSDGRRYRQGVITCATCHDVHRNGPLGKLLRKGVDGGRGEVCVVCHTAQETILGTRHDLSTAQGSTCGPCHPVHDPLGVATWPAARGGGDRSTFDLADFCMSCHHAGGSASAAVVGERAHPGNTAARGKKVGCGACHDPHRWNPADAADRGGGKPGDAGTMFLVRSAAGPADLCISCHADQALVAGTPHDLRKLASLPPGTADPRSFGVCAPCHRVHGDQPLAVPILRPTKVPRRGEKMAAGPDPCELCHAAGKIAAASVVGERGHPVGIVTGQDYGSDLPLYGLDGRHQSGGRIACGTCHDPHRWEPAGGSGGSGKAATSFLRLGADGYAPLCFPCHADKSMIVGTDHDLRVTAPASVNLAGEVAESSGVCGVCHAIHRAPAGLALFSRRLGEGKDNHSRACTACHRPGNDQGARVPPRVEPHLVNYPGRGLVSRRFRPTRTTPPGGAGIALFAEDGAPAEQGYLTCASCHDVHRWESDVSNSGSGVAVEGNAANSFLRVPSGALERTLCAECHAPTLVEHYRGYHFPEGK